MVGANAVLKKQMWSVCLEWLTDWTIQYLTLLRSKFVLWPMPKLSWEGSLLSFSFACLGCSRAAMTSCGRQSYREMPVSQSCPASNGCMGFSCKSVRVLAATVMCLEVPPFTPELTASCTLNEFMSTACSILFLPCSGLPAKQHIKESCDTYPRHSLVAKLCQREWSTKHMLRFVSTVKEFF